MLSKRGIRGKGRFSLSRMQYFFVARLRDAEVILQRVTSFGIGVRDIHAEGIRTLRKNHQGSSLKGKSPNGSEDFPYQQC